MEPQQPSQMPPQQPFYPQQPYGAPPVYGMGQALAYAPAHPAPGSVATSPFTGDAA